MYRLAEADQRRLMSVNHESQDAVLLEPHLATGFVLSALAALVPSDCTVHRWEPGGDGWPLVTATDPQLEASQRAGREHWADLVSRGDHPVVAGWERSGDERALRLSDVVGAGAVHRLEVYNEFWRPFSIERTMGGRVQMSKGKSLILACYRTGRDFTDRDRAVLDAILFTAVQVVRRAEMRPLVASLVTTLGLTMREAEIIAWVTRGGTNAEIGALLFIAPGTVKKHLDNVYRKLAVGTRTEAAGLALGAWWGTNARTALSDLGDSTRAAIGITRREADVLALAGRGMTNAGIGAALGMSAGTAKHHLENVYRKLDAGSRTDATTRAMAAISGHAPTAT
jgi:DNA-binding CsgD family transcriptional regulator